MTSLGIDESLVGFNSELCQVVGNLDFGRYSVASYELGNIGEASGGIPNLQRLAGCWLRAWLRQKKASAIVACVGSRMFLGDSPGGEAARESA